MKKIQWGVLGLIMICYFFIVIGCTKHKAAVAVGSCDPNVVYFTKDILPILNSNCNMSGCHTGNLGAEFSLTYYYAVMKYVSVGNPNSSKIYEAVTSTKGRKMPPNGSLTQSQIDLLSAWITQGASNEVCDDNGTCDTSNVKYSATISTIIANNCAGCHSGSNISGGADLSNYPGVSAQISNGKLLGTINFSSGYNQMPPTGSQLSSCDRNKIQQWIKLNHPQN